MILDQKKKLNYILNNILEKVPVNKKFILIHFNLIPFFNFKIDLNNILLLIKNRFKNNTILMPTFTFNFNKLKKWSYKNSKSESGALSELFRKESNGRTIHPIHSIAYYGKHHSLIPRHECNSSFGKKSTWEWICESGDVLNLSIGSKFNGGATFIHYLEELFKVPYREYIYLKGKILNSNNKPVNKEFIYYARKNGCINSYRRCENFLIKKSIIKYHYENKIPYFFCDIKKATRMIKREFKKDTLYLLRRPYSRNANSSF